ncbi:MAG: type II toxin-antitoxin system VapC family toxin [Sphaerospermopsis sp. SIO1G2]|nr:type II toxin-antitoxin system VapC family toxin [Sphaerospermopsis sp. SIO1G2]
MIGLDTNILIRYFAQDDAKQSAKASEIIEQQLSKEHPAFIGSIVLVEMVWVLTRLYKMQPVDIMLIVKELINAVDIQLEHHEETWKAHQLVLSDNLDFSDALLGAIHHRHGCNYTLTFDRKAATSELFKAA